MKLGICYMVFDGEELLPFAIKSIRNCVDFVSVTYQTTSYFNNQSNPLPTLLPLKEQNLIDQLIFYQPNLSLKPKENELILRNIGLDASKNANCTHHISADTDEFYTPQQLLLAKSAIKQLPPDLDFTAAYLDTYYKEPTFLVHPPQTLLTSFIHPVNNQYNMNNHNFPLPMEITRQFSNCKNFHVFKKSEITAHHMSYVRKNIRKKFQNSDNGKFYNIDNFVKQFDNYKVGERVCLLPDFMNRKTVLVDNIFNINIKDHNDS